MRAAVARAAMRRGCVWPIKPADAAPELEADFRQLRGLARAGFAADDHHLMLGDRLRDVGAPRADRQLFRVFGLGAGGAALLEFGRGVPVLLRIHAPAVDLLGLHPAHSTGSGDGAPKRNACNSAIAAAGTVDGLRLV